ncbi:MAG TPA: PQQ-binding-like beta-propeller repeat protein [Gemmatimonadaceae bacterium]|jgi:PQQ-dependent dehydrogenase (methanol/ethanol family)|nr:PQQ-binding-like beta-propeller repeat protein [Gemmatimonadaceae bacterium]
MGSLDACASVRNGLVVVFTFVFAGATTALQAQSNWTTYGGSDWNQRWSNLDQINTKNVGSLVPRMVLQTGTKPGSFENTPIVDGDVMYVTTPYNDAVFAYDLAKKKELWRFGYKLAPATYCCGPNNRGVALADGKVFFGTLDGHLVALDASTGKQVWDAELAPVDSSYSITAAPLVVGKNVVVGVSGGEYGIRGHLDAVDIASGKPAWRWYSIPAPGEDSVAPNGWWGTWAPKAEEADLHRDIAREKADSAKYPDSWKRGGGGVWMTPAYDKELNLLYFTVGNPSPDLDGSVRPGDNLFTDCIVAVDATTGKTRWYYQVVPHDVWDLDQTSPPVVMTLDGQKVVVQAGKTAWMYVLDAKTGKLVRKTENFTPQKNMFALPTAEGTLMLPGANGGSEWSPISVDPKLHYAFVAGLNQPMLYKVHPAPYEKGRLWLGSAFNLAPGASQNGTFTAIDLSTGKIAWQKQMEEPMMGGSVATAGGLVFTGEGNGNFNAFDAKTGKLLWQFNGGAGCNAAPMSFEWHGEQLIGVACGGNFQLGYPLGGAVFVFGLPKKGS